MKRNMQAIRKFFATSLAAFAALYVVSYCHGCRPVLEKTAEVTYLGQQLECVDNLSTKADIDGCRDSVKRRWAKDAGGQ